MLSEEDNRLLHEDRPRHPDEEAPAALRGTPIAAATEFEEQRTQDRRLLGGDVYPLRPFWELQPARAPLPPPAPTSPTATSRGIAACAATYHGAGAFDGEGNCTSQYLRDMMHENPFGTR